MTLNKYFILWKCWTQLIKGIIRYVSLILAPIFQPIYIYDPFRWDQNKRCVTWKKLKAYSVWHTHTHTHCKPFISLRLHIFCFDLIWMDHHLTLPNCKLVKIKSSNVWYYNVYHFRKKIEHQPHRSMYYREKRYLKNPD